MSQINSQINDIKLIGSQLYKLKCQILADGRQHFFSSFSQSNTALHNHIN